ncbi:MAG: archease [Pyrodictiaceae archaeon]
MAEDSFEPTCPGYSHAPHTADEIVVAKGRSLEEAFEQAALGVYEIMTDTSRVEPRVEKRVVVEGFDLENLLYKWIEELLVITDSEGMVFSRFKVHRIERRGEEEYLLEASAWGEKFDPSRHEHRTIVKAMTYSLMEIRREDGCWRLQFVVDI